MTSLKTAKNADKSLDDLDKSKEKDNKAFYRKKKIKNKTKRYFWRKTVFLFLITATLVVTVVSSLPFLKNRQNNMWLPQLKWFPIKNCQSIKFEPFIIPFNKHGKFTYISLSISFELPNKELMDEMIEKSHWIRGIIYNILSNNIYVLENVSSLTKLKKFIINGVNQVLTAGKVNKAIITDFSTV
jgi:flagellar basal body-associated protein FliL